MVRNPPANAGDIRGPGSIAGLGRSPGKGNDNPLQYSFLENSMDGGAWYATIHGVAKSRTRLHFHFHFHIKLQSSDKTGKVTASQMQLESVVVV